MKFFLLLLFIINTLSATDKIALLIGNTDYKFQPLSNPINDVRAIKKTLIEIGFKEKNVMVLENASRQEMMNALYEFRERGKKAEIALVYFSGHGMQIDGKNFMFPKNTTFKTSLDKMGLINLNFFINSTTTAKYGVILVDACRDNPLSVNFQDKKYKSSTGSIKKGLGKVKMEFNEIIVGFATKAGSVAEDGNGNLSPYAEALTKQLKLNLDIRMVLGEVSFEVYNATKMNSTPQIPSIEYLSLRRNSVCLTGICTGGNSNNNTQNIFIEPNRKNIKTLDNLMYQSQPSMGRFTWAEAKRYCEKLTLKDYSNWRLPSKKELSKILKRESIKQKEIHLWTQYRGKDSLVWAIDVNENEWYRSETPKKWKNPSLCVRNINKKGKR